MLMKGAAVGNLTWGNGNITLISSLSLSFTTFLTWSFSWGFVSILHLANKLSRVISFVTPGVFFQVLRVHFTGLVYKAAAGRHWLMRPH